MGMQTSRRCRRQGVAGKAVECGCWCGRQGVRGAADSEAGATETPSPSNVGYVRAHSSWPRRLPPPRPFRRRPPLAPPPLAAPIRPAPTTVRPEAEKLSGMSLTTVGGGSNEWNQMNTRNRDLMKRWRQSPDLAVNKGKTTVGVPMREVDPGIPTMNVDQLD